MPLRVLQTLLVVTNTHALASLTVAAMGNSDDLVVTSEITHMRGWIGSGPHRLNTGRILLC